ncbi:MAG: hypothetical protein ACLP7O_04660 [Terracidiphilus sp.]
MGGIPQTSTALLRLQTRHGKPSYAYYANGNVETIASSNANGASVSSTYDELNRLSSVTDGRLQGNQTTTYTYDPASNVSTVKYPNGLTSSFTYDTLNRLTELSTPPVADYRHTLGLTGNRTNATEQSGRMLQWSYGRSRFVLVNPVAKQPGPPPHSAPPWLPLTSGRYCTSSGV